jgi:hypothetical protein
MTAIKAVRVLVACEFSGIVRDAFRARGHDAVSCDLLPTERPGPHIVGDARVVVRRWRPDLLIHHTPCTYATNAGVRWLYVNGRGTVRDETRWAAMVEGAALFQELQSADVPMICGENPIPHRYALGLMGPYTQIIQPWQFGHGETKATCLWLRGLPPLTPTQIVNGRDARVHREAPSPDRWKNRSRTLPGIAAAMAAQWGALVRQERAA